MDLIYADRNFYDVGIIKAYNFDLAYGRDENNFELEIPLENHCCKVGYCVYVNGTEYGGMIDSIGVDTKNNTVTYKGRTWHGVLASKGVLEDTSKPDGLYANEWIRQLLNESLLYRFIHAYSAEDGPLLTNLEPISADNLYEYIIKALDQVGYKLTIKSGSTGIILIPQKYVDYSSENGWDSSQVDFIAEEREYITNHIRLIGGLKDGVNVPPSVSSSNKLNDLFKYRYSYDVYCYSDGSIRKISKNNPPLMDSDYYLNPTERRENCQGVSGYQEITETMMFDSPKVVENYILLSKKPDDWETDNVVNYYKAELNEDGEVCYNQVELLSNSTFHATALSSQPADWATSFNKYYEFDATKREYVQVNSVTTDNYQVMASAPWDWLTNYKNYYYFYSDGVTSEYRAVSGLTGYRIDVQTSQPTDWASNYTNYYEYYNQGWLKIDKYSYSLTTTKPSDWTTHPTKYYYKSTELGAAKWVQVKASDHFAWHSKTFYKRGTAKAPTWKANLYGTQISYEYAPQFSVNKYYLKTQTVGAPTFQANKYYSGDDIISTYSPAYAQGDYYRKVEDHYASMIQSALDKFKELYDNKDVVTAKFDSKSEDYDIGDYIEASEASTGVKIRQRINKKIITIEDGISKTSYEIGI